MSLLKSTTHVSLDLQRPNYVTVYATQNDRLSRYINAELHDGATGFALPTGAGIAIAYRKPDGTGGFYDTLEDGSSAFAVETDGTVTIGLAEQALTVPGTVPVELRIYLPAAGGGSRLTTWYFVLQVGPSVLDDAEIVSSDYYNVLTDKITQAQQLWTQIQAGFGAPLTSTSLEAMTDGSKVYVYVGAADPSSTPPMVFGHWYYWDGAATPPQWRDGGVYQTMGVQTDKTLSIADAAADAKATGALALGISDRVDVLTGSINYGFDRIAELTEEPQSSTATQRLGIRRELTRITLNMSNPIASLLRTKISGNTLSRSAATASVDRWGEGFVLKPGHIYRIDCKLIGGSVTVAVGYQPPRIAVYPVGGHSSLSTTSYNGLDTVAYFTATGSLVNLSINVDPGTVLDNAVYQVILRDKADLPELSDAPGAYDAAQPSSAGNIVIPALVHSEQLLNYDYNADGTTRRVTQGICSDGKRYLFFPLKQNAGEPGDDELPVMVKWDTVSNAPVVLNTSAPKSYGHVEDMCFVPAYVPGFDNGNVDRLYLIDMNRSTAAGETGTIHVLDANTLDFITSVVTYDASDDSKNLISLSANPYWHGVYHVGYSPELERFFVHSALADDSGSYQTLATFDSTGALVSGITFNRAKGTVFGCDCDANYIYLNIYLVTSTEDVFDIRMSVFDWDLNPIATAKIDQKTWEIEGACHIGNTFYFSWIRKAGSARTGALVTKQTYCKKQFFPVGTAFPVGWLNTVFPTNTFETFA